MKKNVFGFNEKWKPEAPFYIPLADLKGVFFLIFFKIREAILLFSRAYPKRRRRKEIALSPLPSHFDVLCTGKHKRRRYFGGVPGCYIRQNATPRNQTKRKK
jgi:hypothetical protein